MKNKKFEVNPHWHSALYNQLQENNVIKKEIIEIQEQFLASLNGLPNNFKDATKYQEKRLIKEKELFESISKTNEIVELIIANTPTHHECLMYFTKYNEEN